ncbi:MAG: hypothetical protein EBZ48_08965 [Proteobacteria bacterium]|nr:hypothetical protein [Pseudomonadota bacterium]
MNIAEGIADILRTDPGNEGFVRYAEELRATGKLSEALLVCLAGVNAAPLRHRGRLLLARVLFELELPLLATRELRELLQYVVHREPLEALISRIECGERFPSEVGQQTLAQTDLSSAALDSLEQAKG